MTIDTTPSFLDETWAAPETLKTVPVQVGDTVMAWRTPSMFSIAEITGIDYGTGYDITAVTCLDVETGETITNALSAVNTTTVTLLASMASGWVEDWADKPSDELYENLLNIARLLQPHLRADAMKERDGLDWDMPR